MGDITDAERLMQAYKLTAQAARDAENVARAAKKGAVWKPVLASVLTFLGAGGGGAFAAGRYFESAKTELAKIGKLETKVDHHDDRIKEAYDLALDAKGIAVLQCHRLDGKWNERICP